MTAAAIPWFIAGISVTAFVALWFSVSYRELSKKRKSLDFMAEEVRLHRGLYMQERGGENDEASENMLETKRMVYRKLVREYNALLKRPDYRVPGYLLGFRPEPDSGN